MRKTKSTVFKKRLDDTFLKTVSAFANYQSGTIIFGIDDDGNVKGMKNLEKNCINIENKINDSISPHPNFTLKIDNHNNTIILDVQEGEFKPYLFKGKAYKRNDTSTIEVNNLELRRLTLEGDNQTFEELQAKDLKLEFKTLGKKLKNEIKIDNLSCDVLKTLNLYTKKNKFNNAGSLLSDSNKFPGIDIVKFKNNIDEIQDRETLINKSILEYYDLGMKLYRKNYQYEIIAGAKRETKESIPEKAFREVLANAIIHRAWDVNANIRISMFNDKIEISSPGGLPNGMNKDEYLNHQVSILRNPIIANVFYRLKIVEAFGTGIKRINKAYKDYIVQPTFEVSENCVNVTLPTIDSPLKHQGLTTEEEIIYNLLSPLHLFSTQEISEKVKFTKSKTLRILNSLLTKKCIKTNGKGKAIRYSR